MRFACFILLVMSGCFIGDPGGNTPEVPGVDASVGPPDAPPAATCKDAVPVTDDGHHNPGEACMSCHSDPVVTKVWTIAGTLYKTGTNDPLPGATIIVTDSTGKEFDLVSSLNGNFWTDRPLTPPYMTAVSLCPTTYHMMQNAVAGDCNQCHQAGTDAGRVRL
jgi:hypothetical protein